MKRFKCTVTRTDEYIIEFDENKFNKKWMDEFAKFFYDFDSLEEHAEHIAQFRARFEKDFIEGYGIPLQNGERPFSVRVNEENEKYLERGINIIIKSEDDDCEVEVEEIS